MERMTSSRTVHNTLELNANSFKFGARHAPQRCCSSIRGVEKAKSNRHVLAPGVCKPVSRCVAKPSVRRREQNGFSVHIHHCAQGLRLETTPGDAFGTAVLLDWRYLLRITLACKRAARREVAAKGARAGASATVI